MPYGKIGSPQTVVYSGTWKDQKSQDEKGAGHCDEPAKNTDWVDVRRGKPGKLMEGWEITSKSNKKRCKTYGEVKQE